MMLHITNGASVSLEKTRLSGSVIFWNDVLHEGPVPAGISFDELTRLREQFLAGYYGLPRMDVSFARRNAAISAAEEQDEVVLWFEHDLYDQLQLVQVLDCFAHAETNPAKLTLINIDRYLGSLEAAELERLFESRRPVTDEQMETAVAAWKAFRAPELTGIEPFVRATVTALPFSQAHFSGTSSSSPPRTTGSPAPSARSSGCSIPASTNSASCSARINSSRKGFSWATRPSGVTSAASQHRATR